MVRLYQTGEEKKLQMHMEFALLSSTCQYFQHNSSLLTRMHSLASLPCLFINYRITHKIPTMPKAPVTEVYSLLEEICLKQSISAHVKNLARRLEINKN